MQKGCEHKVPRKPGKVKTMEGPRRVGLFLSTRFRKSFLHFEHHEGDPLHPQASSQPCCQASFAPVSIPSAGLTYSQKAIPWEHGVRSRRED